MARLLSLKASSWSVSSFFSDYLALKITSHVQLLFHVCLCVYCVHVCVGSSACMNPCLWRSETGIGEVSFTLIFETRSFVESGSH